MSEPSPAAATHLRAIRFSRVTVLLDLRTGLVQALPRTTVRHRSVPVTTTSFEEVIGHEPTPSWGTRESLAALPPAPPTSWRWLPVSLVALTVVLIIRALGPRHHRFARIRRLAAQHPSGRTDWRAARQALRSVRRVGRLVPARVACLEESAAAVLALRLAGYRADWKYGAATDPVRLHAWVEVDGHAVDEPADITDYTPFEETT